MALVRVADEDLAGMERRKFVEASNTSATEGRSVAELALADRKVLSDPGLLVTLDPLEDGSFNRDFLRAFYEALGAPKELRKVGG